jgi:hypothetical protein
MYTISRNGCYYLAELQEINETDFVLAIDGNFLSATDFPEIRSQFDMLRERDDANSWKSLFTIAALTFFGYVIIDTLNTPPTKCQRRRLRYNDEPLPAWKRDYVRERDGETCVYCGALARDGHADHRKSRFNGGSNHLNNLSWACRRCNLQKGTLNARQFVQVLNA